MKRQIGLRVVLAVSDLKTSVYHIRPTLALFCYAWAPAPLNLTPYTQV